MLVLHMELRHWSRTLESEDEKYMLVEKIQSKRDERLWKKLHRTSFWTKRLLKKIINMKEIAYMFDTNSSILLVDPHSFEYISVIFDGNH